MNYGYPNSAEFRISMKSDYLHGMLAIRNNQFASMRPLGYGIR